MKQEEKVAHGLCEKSLLTDSVRNLILIFNFEEILKLINFAEWKH